MADMGDFGVQAYGYGISNRRGGVLLDNSVISSTFGGPLADIPSTTGSRFPRVTENKTPQLQEENRKLRNEVDDLSRELARVKLATDEDALAALDRKQNELRELLQAGRQLRRAEAQLAETIEEKKDLERRVREIEREKESAELQKKEAQARYEAALAQNRELQRALDSKSGGGGSVSVFKPSPKVDYGSEMRDIPSAILAPGALEQEIFETETVVGAQPNTAAGKFARRYNNALVTLDNLIPKNGTRWAASREQAYDRAFEAVNKIENEPGYNEYRSAVIANIPAADSSGEKGKEEEEEEVAEDLVIDTSKVEGGFKFYSDWADKVTEAAEKESGRKAKKLNSYATLLAALAELLPDDVPGVWESADNRKQFEAGLKKLTIERESDETAGLDAPKRVFGELKPARK